MLKKLSIAGLALIASGGLAFAADSNDAMPTSDAATAPAADSSTAPSSAATEAPAPKKHKKHHHKTHHHKAHHHHAAAAAAPAADPVTAAAPVGGYKGEVPCPACPRIQYMVGPYLGFSVGSRVNFMSNGASYNGAEGTLFGGYSMLWDQWYGALEINVADSAQITNYTNSNNANTSANAKSSWSYGLSVLPGYLLTDDVLGFIRLGVIRTRFSSGNNNSTGGVVGLGMETQLCTNWDLRGEYDYDFYNSLSNNGGNPKTSQYNLGLVYKFQM